MIALALLVMAAEVAPCVEVEGMACIPGGAFLRGTNDGDASARPQASVWLQTFLMDTHEVTVANYRACIETKKCAKAGPSYDDFDDPKQPITGVSWFHAKAYCEAQGKRLPTEAQWEKAARGVDGRTYPWGNEPATCALAIYRDASGRSCGVKQKSKKHADVGRPEPVGSRAPNAYGLYDMAGNSWEWVADWHSPTYATCGRACLGDDPLGPCAGKSPCPGHTRRVVRGGSWYWPTERMTTFHRRQHDPANTPVFHHFGFRCAATVDDVKVAKP